VSYAVNVALQAALAGLVAGRVYPIRLPDDPVYPSLRYSNVNTNNHNTLCGPSNLTDARYRVDIFATTVKECDQIAASILAIMRGPAFGYQNTPLANIDGYEPTVGLYRKTLDFQIWEAQAMT
jgi:Protein of unknown function (DUF3168)